MDGPSTHMAGMSPLLGSSLQTKATGTEGWDGRPLNSPGRPEADAGHSCRPPGLRTRPLAPPRDGKAAPCGVWKGPLLPRWQASHGPRRWEHLWGCGGSWAEHRWMDKNKGKRKATEGQAIHTPISEDEETEAPSSAAHSRPDHPSGMQAMGRRQGGRPGPCSHRAEGKRCGPGRAPPGSTPGGAGVLRRYLCPQDQRHESLKLETNEVSAN